jgi:hypothetical protein
MSAHHVDAAIEVVAGTERLIVTGRAAVIVAQVALHAAAINRIPVGRLVVDFAQAKTKVELTESFPAVRVDLGSGSLRDGHPSLSP